MRLFIFVMTCLGLHVSSTAQEKKFRLDVKNAQLSEVVQDIANKMECSIIFEHGSDNNAKPVNACTYYSTVQEALDIVLKDQPIKYVQNGLFFTLIDTVQTKRNIVKLRQTTLEGTIYNSGGGHVAGATVQVMGTDIPPATTNSEGQFKFPNAPYIGKLQIRYRDYEPIEKPYDTSPVNIRIEQYPVELKGADVKPPPVNLPFAPAKELSTGNMSVINGQIINRQLVNDPLVAIQGRAAGLRITQTSGVPGARPDDLIRGKNSISHNNGPLYVVDGIPIISFPYPQTSIAAVTLSIIANIRPENIESIEVLKDAVATAIYGSRGANGVIVFKTRKTLSGRFSVTFDASLGTGKVPRRMKLLDTPQYLEMRNEAFKNDGAVPGRGDYDVNGTWNSKSYTDWQKVLFGNPSKIMRYTLAISAGDTNTHFIAGGSIHRETTVMPGDYYNMVGAANLSLHHATKNKKIQFDLTGGYTSNYYDLPKEDFTPYSFMAPNTPAIFDDKGDLNWENGTFNNPIGRTQQQSTSHTQNILLNYSLMVNPLASLYFNVHVGYNYMGIKNHTFTPSSSFSPYSENPTALRVMDNGTNNLATRIANVQAKYAFKIRKNVQIDMLAILEAQQTTQRWNTLTARGYSSDSAMKDFWSATSISGSGNGTQYRYGAFSASISANYKQKYAVDLILRRDGSNRFGEKTRVGNFGAIGGAWLFYRDSLIKSLFPALSAGKLRFSAGITGSDPIEDNLYSSYYQQAYGYFGVPGLTSAQLSNPLLKREQTNKIEAGIEIGLFKKLNINLSLYRNVTHNQIMKSDLAGTTGFPYITDNLDAKVQNTGFEVEAFIDSIQSKNFTWLSSLNFSLFKNKIISFPGLAQSGHGNLLRINEPTDIKLFPRLIRVNPETGQYEFTTKTYPVYFGPRANGGLSNTFIYKNFSLDMFLYFVIQSGASVVGLATPGRFINSGSSQPGNINDRWRTTGDQANIQKVSAKGAEVNQSNITYNQSDARKKDASYIRLKNVCFSYTLPGSEHVQLYVQAQNLFTITRYKGLDPETQSLSGLWLPPQRQYSIGVKITSGKK